VTELKVQWGMSVIPEITAESTQNIFGVRNTEVGKMSGSCYFCLKDVLIKTFDSNNSCGGPERFSVFKKMSPRHN
jgi:hypothetical protein